MTAPATVAPAAAPPAGEAGPIGERHGPLPTRATSAPGSFWIAKLANLAGAAPAAARAIAPLVVPIAWAAAPSLRDGTLRNARWLLGEHSSPRQRRRLARRTVASFYRFICEVGAAGRTPPKALAAQVREVRGREHFDAATAMGRGVIVVTAHLGSFETGVVSLRGLAPRVHVVFKRDEIEAFERLRSHQRERLGVLEAPVDEGWTVWLRLRDALAAGDVVLLQGDRVMPGQSGVKVPMLGGHVVLPSGPVKLALATGAPIVPVFSVRRPRRDGGGIAQIIERPIIVEPGSAARGQIHPAMLELAAVLERTIKDYPDQWLMLHRVWCEDHGSEPPHQRPRGPR